MGKLTNRQLYIMKHLNLRSLSMGEIEAATLYTMPRSAISRVLNNLSRLGYLQGATVDRCGVLVGTLIQERVSLWSLSRAGAQALFDAKKNAKNTRRTK